MSKYLYLNCYIIMSPITFQIVWQYVASHKIYLCYDIPGLCFNAKLLVQENDLLQMERTVLTSLEFRMMPTAYTFWSVYRMGYTMHNPSASLASYLMVRTQTMAQSDFVSSLKSCILYMFCADLIRMIPPHISLVPGCRN